MIGLILASALSTPDNVLLVILDDISNQFVNAYGEGPASSQPPTPHLDRLARHGVLFNNAYSNPLCSPTRATIFTGRYSFRTGIGHIIQANSGEGLRRSETTLPELMHLAGYTSALAGKWHLGQTTSTLIDPILHGWDLFVGTRGNISDYWSYRQDLAFPWVSKKLPPTDYSTVTITSHALELVDRLPEPWFVTVSYHAPHTPWHVPPSHLHTQGNPESYLEMYMAMVEAVDTELGRLLHKVDLDDTTVIVLADNGTVGDSLEAPGKGTLYEGGVNVPMIVAGSAVPAESAGTVTEALVNTTDLYETILGIAGLTGRAEDSISILPVLRDPSRSMRDLAFAEHFKPNQAVPPITMRMVRDRRYKLIRPQDGTSTEEFFDLAEALPGTDGPSLPLVSLNREQREAYTRLDAFLRQVPLP
jgi:arylsulfatase A-like enzyme